MIKINSELPICMLDRNNELNEFDFILYHLYISNEEYREFCKYQRSFYPERLMILDNSAYEFFVRGETLDMDDFVRVINELKPDFYILPDTLMNMDKTLKDTKEFLNKYKIRCSRPMAVLQGNTMNELIACMFLYKDLKIKNIAIPFHNSFYKDPYPPLWSYIRLVDKYNTSDLTEDMKYAAGRIRFIEYIKMRYLHEDFDHIHILGSHCPAEKLYYKDIIQIKTMDTGYPVKCAIEGYELFKEPKKPEIIIDDFMNDELKFDCKQLIRDNVTKFRLL